MPRSFYIILIAFVVVSLTVPVPLQAQHGGGSHGGGSHGGAVHGGGGVSARPAPSLTGRGPVTTGRGPVTPFVNPPVNTFGRAPQFSSRPIHRHERPIVVAPVYGYGYPYGGYGYGYPYDYSPYYSAPVVSEPYYSEPQPVYSQGATDQSNAELSYQVGELSRQIQDLRQQQAQAAQPVPVPPAMPVVLIFKDGRRMEIQNYAIIGQTLWVLDERNSTKIPLGDLDLNATQVENRSRGLRFSMPGQ